VSNKGEKKLLKIIGNRVCEYCDKIYPEAIRNGEVIAYALNPPVVYHNSNN
jgi:thioredoxin-related protein